MTLILYRGGRQTLVIADVKEGIGSYKRTVPDHLDTRDDYTVQMVSESHAEESGEFSISNPNGDSTDDSSAFDAWIMAAGVWGATVSSYHAPNPHYAHHLGPRSPTLTYPPPAWWQWRVAAR